MAGEVKEAITCKDHLACNEVLTAQNHFSSQNKIKVKEQNENESTTVQLPGAIVNIQTNSRRTDY